MTEINFRVVCLPRQNTKDILSQICGYIKQCSFKIKSIERMKLEKLNDPALHESYEFISNIYATCSVETSSNNKAASYKKLSEEWLSVTSKIPIDRPLLQFFNDESFYSKQVSCNKYRNLISLKFGVYRKCGEFVYFHRIVDNMDVAFYHDMKEIVIDIDSNIRPRTYQTLYHLVKEEYKNTYFIPYKSINSIVVDGYSIYLHLLHPPLYNRKTIITKTDLIGQINILTELKRSMLYGVNPDVFGKSNVVCIGNFGSDGYKWEVLLASLRSSCDKIPIHFVKMETDCKLPPETPEFEFLDFECAYLWNAILNRSYSMLVQSNDLETDVAKLIKYCQNDPGSLELSLKALLPIMDSGKFVNYWYVLDTLYSSFVTRRKSGHCFDYVIPPKCRLIRRVTITPTRLLLWPADLMHENRVLRNFDSDFYLRVTIRDDDLLTMNFRSYSLNVFQKVFQPLNDGLNIGSRRHYELLGWSSSQLREHGVSMYAKDNQNRTAASIREWTEIKPSLGMNIPKCLARMGQCFSQTDETLNVPLYSNSLQVIFERDIEHGYNAVTGQPYCFSDGIGRISKSLADEVKQTLRHAEGCSAFQIRYGGCKGMLVIDPTLQGKQIIFRNSMQKFQCQGVQHTKLEIAKISSPISLRLNRPLIAILNDLGVPHVVFLKLQENMLQNLLDMLLNEEEAAKILKMRTPFSMFSVDNLSKSGIALTIEPFFRTLLLALHRYYIDLIKTKANIDIDPSYARNMFGVLDETGILEYGQVFVQYSSDISLGKTTPEDTKILNGLVMVTKCPCVHPADIRNFIAVDVPELHHIVDCIVFPQRGKRPHPDEMAGSDLDGDEYAVIWMKDLMFSRLNYPPPDYPKPVTDKYRNVFDFFNLSQTDEVSEFLKDYIENDQIGNIASAHLSLADSGGIESEICLEIAMIHAVAVDFPKTGISANLERRHRPRKYPDFMEKFFRKKYRSRKSLGKMYRISKDFENVNETIRIVYRDIQVDPLLKVDGWREFEETAVASRNEYNSALKHILQTYGINHETEAFGGAFIKLHPRFRERRDRAEIVSLVHMWLKQLVEKTKEHFFSEFKESGSVKTITKRMYCKASAWYIVTYRDKNSELLSFPWIVSDLIANIRMQNQFEKNKNIFPLVTRLEEIINDNKTEDIFLPLPPEVNNFLQSFYYKCKPIIFERAVAILMKWGVEEELITTSSYEDKFLYKNVFLKLILYVAEHENYVSRYNYPPLHKTSHYKTALLCLAFFNYCMKLRFLKKDDLGRMLPFKVYKVNLLAKKALVTYHTLAVTGIFYTLQPEECLEESFSMKPIPIDVSLLGESPLAECKLRNAEHILKDTSGVDNVELRECLQRKKVMVSAFGRKTSVWRLRELLRKKPEYLMQFFNKSIVV